MKVYPIPMIPGPVKVPDEVLQAYLTNYGSADLEAEYLELYGKVQSDLQQICATRNRFAILTGEGMLPLWAALKSAIRPGERVLALATGVFGYGMADMARAIGANVRTVEFAYDQTLHDWDRIEAAIVEFQPKMITVVHCETPSGTLNPIEEVGRLKTKHGVPLLYVDVVASMGGAPVLTDAWQVDFTLGGTQKVLSAPPGMSFVAVSENAWEIIREVDYVGYDALKPFDQALQKGEFPYTPYWHGLAALHMATQNLLRQGLEASYAHHLQVAAFCRNGIEALGLTLFPGAGAIPAPTVTAVKVPVEIGWEAFNRQLRSHGLAVGGSYGPLAGRVFRLGHMGTQCDEALVEETLNVIKQVIA